MIVPDGDPLVEVGWTDAARQKSIQTRMSRAYGQSRPAGFGRKPKAASGGGGGGGGGTPKKTGTTNNAAGEAVHSFSDGGSVTVHKDGKATYTRADGTKVTGTYKEPAAPREKRPAGFTGDDDPSVIKKKERDAATAQKKAERDAKAAATKKAQAARGYYPGAAKLDKVRVSRTQKGPRAGTKALTGWRASLNPQPE